MDYQMKHEEGKHIFYLEGDFESSSNIEFRRALANLDIRDIVLDFEKVSYIDTSGIGLIISLHKKATINGGKLEIINANDKIRRIFELGKIDKIINIS